MLAICCLCQARLEAKLDADRHATELMRSEEARYRQAAELHAQQAESWATQLAREQRELVDMQQRLTDTELRLAEFQEQQALLGSSARAASESLNEQLNESKAAAAEAEVRPLLFSAHYFFLLSFFVLPFLVLFHCVCLLSRSHRHLFCDTKKTIWNTLSF